MAKLIESAYFVDYKVQEGVGDGRPLLVSGVFGRADAKNQNGRVYPRNVWEKVLREGSDAMDRIRTRNLFGELDHPDDGRTLLQRTSHIVTRLGMNQDGTIVGEAEILPTPSGRILETLFRANTKVGISSRGEGDVVHSEGVGADVVQDNYDLQAFDFVHNPSTQGAYPRRMFEGRSREGEGRMDHTREYQDLRASVDELLSFDVSNVAPAVRPLFERQVQETERRIVEAVGTSGEHKPLFVGLLSEFHSGVRAKAPRRNFVQLGEEDVATIPRMKSLMGTTGSTPGEATGSAADGTEQLPPEVAPTSVPQIPGSETGAFMAHESKTKTGKKEESKMTMRKTKLPRALQIALREAEDEIDKIEAEDNQPEVDKAAQEEVAKCESRLLRLAKKGLKEQGDPVPSVYAPAAPQGEMEIKTEQDDEMDEDEGNVEVPPPPKDVATENDDLNGDEDELPEADDIPKVGEGENPFAKKTEARVAATIRRLVRENKKLRWQKKVTEAVAANALRSLAKRVKVAESRSAAPASFVANGHRISVADAPAVIESLVAKYKGLRQTVTESTETPSEPVSPPRFAEVGNMRSLTEAASRPAKESTLTHQARLGAQLAARIGRK